MAGEYRFSFGPWNIHEGADPFGPTVRRGVTFARKLKLYKKLGFDGVQFHDDDAVPDMNNLSPKEIAKKAAEVRQMLADGGSDGRVRRPAAVGRPADHRRRLHVERPEGPRVREDRSRRAHRHRRGPGHQADRPVARPRRHVHPRGQGQQGRRGPAGRRDRRHARTTIRISRSPSSPSPTSRWTTPTSRPPATPWPWPL